MNQNEIAPRRRAVTGERRERADGAWSGARRLARLELYETWPSYLIALLVALFIGLVAVSLLWAGQDEAGDGGLPATLLMDGMFLFLLANLGVNWTSSRWTYVHRDPFTLRVSFLRTLPISVRDLILGRLTVVLATTAVASLAFFVPSYALFPGLRAEIPPAQYLWFALFWIGYALFSGSILLFLEMGVRGRATLAVLLVWSVLLVSILVLAQALNIPLARGSLELVVAYGPLVAVPVMAAGGGWLLLWCWLLERRLRTRELAS